MESEVAELKRAAETGAERVGNVGHDGWRPTLALGILEAHLAKQPFVTGREFTCKDVPLAAAAQRWFNLPIRRPSHPAVEAWYAQLRQRPAFKKWIDIPLT